MAVCDDVTLDRTQPPRTTAVLVSSQEVSMARRVMLERAVSLPPGSRRYGRLEVCATVTYCHSHALILPYFQLVQDQLAGNLPEAALLRGRYLPVWCLEFEMSAPLDLTKLKVLPLAQRRSLARLEDILVDAYAAPPLCSA